MNNAKLEHPEIFDDITGLPLSSADLVEIARQVAGDRMLLSYSGRDSLAMWSYLVERGVQVIPYWCYSVPGLSYDEEMIRYTEDRMQTHIIRLPHPRLYELLRIGAYHPPHTYSILAHANLARFEFSDIEDYLAAQFGLGDNYLCAVGIKASDNLMRLRLIRQMGPIGYKKRHYYFAIWDWKTADVKNYLMQHDLKLSKSYLYFGSTGDGIDYNFIRYLKDHLPDDYQKVVDVFPMADIELFRYEAVR